MAKKKCKHEWRQTIAMWSGCTDAKFSFYCIHCLKISPHDNSDNFDFEKFAKEVQDE